MITLNPINSVISAVITAIIVQTLSVYNFGKYSVPLNDDNDKDYGNKIKFEFERAVPHSFIAHFTCNSDEILNRDENLNVLTDAIFVSHGQEIEFQRFNEEGEEHSSTIGDINVNEISEQQDVVIETSEVPVVEITPETFHALLQNDWLILTYVDWTVDMRRFKEHFITKYAQSTDKLNFAIIDAEKYPFLAGQLQVREYPSLSFVTESGRLRPWPFTRIEYINQDILRFFTHSLWSHLPVYQQLHLESSNISGIQIAIFNMIAKPLIKHVHPVLSMLIEHNPNYTIAIACMSILSLIVMDKKLKWTRFIF